MNEIYYTGVGSRTTPTVVLSAMHDLAVWFANLGLVLRSGSAIGADTAFEAGCNSANGKKEIWVADGRKPGYVPGPHHFELAATYHPMWGQLPAYVKSLHARNMGQVLGKDLKTPSSFVICWTPDGCEEMATRIRKTGGTGMAISAASDHSIPVINMFNKDYKDRVASLLCELPI